MRALRMCSLHCLMDCTRAKACPGSALIAASRVNPTCSVEPGNDEREVRTTTSSPRKRGSSSFFNWRLIRRGQARLTLPGWRQNLVALDHALQLIDQPLDLDGLRHRRRDHQALKRETI